MPKLTIQIPETHSLISERADAYSPSSKVFNGPAPAAANAVGAVLNTPNAGRLLQGLNEMFGGATEYAIGGSTALQLHLLEAGLPVTRKPNDLDVVVSPQGFASLGTFNNTGLNRLDFMAIPNNSGRLLWLGNGTRKLGVDICAAKQTVAGNGFSAAVERNGLKVIPATFLKANLEIRISQQPNNDNAKADLLAISELLAKQQQLGVSLS